jgi:hypothetical protein
MRRNHEGHVEIGIGARGRSQHADVLQLVQALPQGTYQDGLQPKNEVAIAKNRRFFDGKILHNSAKFGMMRKNSENDIWGVLTFAAEISSPRIIPDSPKENLITPKVF